MSASISREPTGYKTCDREVSIVARHVQKAIGYGPLTIGVTDSHVDRTGSLGRWCAYGERAPLEFAAKRLTSSAPKETTLDAISPMPVRQFRRRRPLLHGAAASSTINSSNQEKAPGKVASPLMLRAVTSTVPARRLGTQKWPWFHRQSRSRRERFITEYDLGAFPKPLPRTVIVIEPAVGRAVGRPAQVQ